MASKFIGLSSSPNKVYQLNEDMETWEEFSPQMPYGNAPHFSHCLWGDNFGNIVVIAGSSTPSDWTYSYHYSPNTDVWTTVELPNITGTVNSIHGFTEDNVYILKGAYVLHWDGTTWSNVHTVAGEGRTLGSLQGSSPDNLWASGSESWGYATIYRYNGSVWERFPAEGTEDFIASARCHAILAFAPDDVFVSMYKTYDYRGRIYHWNGLTWSMVYESGYNAAATTIVDLHGETRDFIVGCGEISMFGSSGDARSVRFDGINWYNVTVASPNDVLRAAHTVESTGIILGTGTASGLEPGIIYKHNAATDTFDQMIAGVAPTVNWVDIASVGVPDPAVILDPLPLDRSNVISSAGGEGLTLSGTFPSGALTVYLGPLGTIDDPPCYGGPGYGYQPQSADGTTVKIVTPPTH